jgi:hypothetical protein
MATIANRFPTRMIVSPDAHFLVIDSPSSHATENVDRY